MPARGETPERASSLLDLIRGCGCRTVAVTGLAKNTGKTTTFNRIVREAAGNAERSGTPGVSSNARRPAAAQETTNPRLLLAGYGHDGEHRDALLEHRKPRIIAPPGALYATIEEFAGSPAHREALGGLGVKTVLGEVGLYRAGSRGTAVELIGINRTSSLRALAADLRCKHDIFLIDGAVDRRSLAVPDLADGAILATGAAILGGPDPRSTRDAAAAVAAATADAVNLLNLPPWDSATRGSGDPVVVEGAFTEGRAAELLALPKGPGFPVVVPNATCVFVSGATLARLNARGVSVFVESTIRLLAVTVNPFSPWGPDLDPGEVEAAVREALPGIPVCNVMSGAYGEVISCSRTRTVRSVPPGTPHRPEWSPSR